VRQAALPTNRFFIRHGSVSGRFAQTGFYTFDPNHSGNRTPTFSWPESPEFGSDGQQTLVSRVLRPFPARKNPRIRPRIGGFLGIPDTEMEDLVGGGSGGDRPCRRTGA